MENLVNRWIAATKTSETSPGAGSEDEAIHEVIDLHLKGNHAALWEFILAVSAKTDSAWVLECLGAGPLEDLLVRYAPEYLERVRETAERSPSFKKALCTVWLDGEDTLLYKEIYKIAGVPPAFDERGEG